MAHKGYDFLKLFYKVHQIDLQSVCFIKNDPTKSIFWKEWTHNGMFSWKNCPTKSNILSSLFHHQYGYTTICIEVFSWNTLTWVVIRQQHWIYFLWVWGKYSVFWSDPFPRNGLPHKCFNMTPPPLPQEYIMQYRTKKTYFEPHPLKRYSAKTEKKYFSIEW